MTDLYDTRISRQLFRRFLYNTRLRASIIGGGEQTESLRGQREKVVGASPCTG